ncbi:prephenate dehydrogenase [Streptococcus loxodontisalivarius]|uniref:Prephenate dehydrogenase n=1 Tax=Streptococcus loxodontisalivarius TaxID=1349415 RepID=A0ABS2PP66_9STRE|nr:prephenate dehydrogenase [Streptococcus loxodontisalivarius]MBM7641738.1 prephenate dehydrogenase [Streptococcus loxodontisalivarius]
MPKKVIYVAGLGLIGGSLALGIKRDHPDYEILGYNRSDKSRNIALERGIVDRATGDFAEFAPLADVIILAVPIKQTIQFLELLAELPLKENVIITDAGSTKKAIVDAAEQFLQGKDIQFVGSHPMAGSHKSGAIAADVTLFENAYYIFTPSSLTKEETIPELKELFSGLLARYVEIDPAEHDRVTSQISHFPHLIASSLMEQAGAYAKEHEMTNHFAAGGFRDMTRIAESEPGMWTSILMTNKEAVKDRIEDFKSRLDHISRLLDQDDEDALWEFFDNGRATRKQMEIHKRGGVESSYDIFVDVPDEEDVILNILELLRGTSIVNIRINEENREDISGILQISFKNQKDLAHAEQVISENTPYSVAII